MNGQLPYSVSKPIRDTLKHLEHLLNDPNQGSLVDHSPKSKYESSVPPPSSFLGPNGISMKGFAATASDSKPYQSAYGAPGSGMMGYGAAYGAPGSTMVPYGAPGSAMVPYGAPGSSMVSKTKNPQANAVSMPAFQTFASHYHEKLQDMDAQLKKHIPGYKPGVKNVDPSRLPDDFFQVKSDEDRFEDVSSLPKNVDEACKGMNKRARLAYEQSVKKWKDKGMSWAQMHAFAKVEADIAGEDSDSDDSQSPVQKKAKPSAPPLKTRQECKQVFKDMKKHQSEFDPGSAETLQWAKDQGAVAINAKRLTKKVLPFLTENFTIYGLLYYMSQNDLNPFEQCTKANMTKFRKFKAEHGLPEDKDWDGNRAACTFPAA